MKPSNKPSFSLFCLLLLFSSPSSSSSSQSIPVQTQRPYLYEESNFLQFLPSYSRYKYVTHNRKVSLTPPICLFSYRGTEDNPNASLTNEAACPEECGDTVNWTSYQGDEFQLGCGGEQVEILVFGSVFRKTDKHVKTCRIFFVPFLLLSRSAA